MMTETGKTVSVIVPVYQVKKYIKATVDTVRAQTYRDWELLLVEDGSTDGTRETIEEYLNVLQDERIRLICLPGNGARPMRAIGGLNRRGADISPIWMRTTCGRSISWSGKSRSRRAERRDLCSPGMNLLMRTERVWARSCGYPPSYLTGRR